MAAVVACRGAAAEAVRADMRLREEEGGDLDSNALDACTMTAMHLCNNGFIPNCQPCFGTSMPMPAQPAARDLGYGELREMDLPLYTVFAVMYVLMLKGLMRLDERAVGQKQRGEHPAQARPFPFPRIATPTSELSDSDGHHSVATVLRRTGSSGVLILG